MTKYYVSMEGNDSANGTSEATAWKSPNMLNQRDFHPGDSISFRYGDTFVVPYSVTLRQGGSQGSPIELCAYGNQDAPYPCLKLPSYDGFAAMLLDKPWLSLFHLRFNSARNGLIVTNAPFFDIAECIFHECAGHGMQLSRLYGPSPGVLIKNCQAYKIGGMGISMTTEENLMCSYNYAHHCCLDDKAPAGDLDMNYTAGIKIFGDYGCTGVIMEHNVCEDNGNLVQQDGGIAKGHGLWIDSVTSQSVDARSNVCRRNALSGLMVELSDAVDLSNNRCYRNGQNDKTPPNRAGIVIFRGATRCRTKNNVCFENPVQIMTFSYPNVGEEGKSQTCTDNVFEENTLLSEEDQLHYAEIDSPSQLRVNEVEEYL